MLGTVDLVEKDTDTLVFWTCDEENSGVVFQIGTSDAVQAVQAANLVFVKILFLSFLCFVAYLQPVHLQILTTLERSLNVPVRCKICLLKTHHDTVELAGRIEKTGVAAIAVHGRKVADRPKGSDTVDGLAEVVSALSIPVIANGDVFEYSDFQCIKDATGRLLL
ncbi:hypothetical protein CY35_02G145100 [Sphagnum magellanicum]|nr:hypothetical protein CY35_02G145100 [Sphagnum magellanicum]